MQKHNLSFNSRWTTKTFFSIHDFRTFENKQLSKSLEKFCFQNISFVSEYNHWWHIFKYKFWAGPCYPSKVNQQHKLIKCRKRRLYKQHTISSFHDPFVSNLMFFLFFQILFDDFFPYAPNMTIHVDVPLKHHLFIRSFIHG